MPHRHIDLQGAFARGPEFTLEGGLQRKPSVSEPCLLGLGPDTASAFPILDRLALGFYFDQQNIESLFETPPLG